LSAVCVQSVIGVNRVAAISYGKSSRKPTSVSASHLL